MIRKDGSIMAKQHMIKEKEQFKVLLLYPNLSMVFSPPLSMAIFTSILKKENYTVDIFDVTPYVGEGCSAPEELEGVNVDEMNSFRVLEGEEQLTFQAVPTEESMQYLMQSRSFSYEDDLEIEKKTGLYHDFTEKIRIYEPDLILCSVVEDTFLQAVKLLSLISDKKIPCLMGGVFTTACPELALSYDNVDMVLQPHVAGVAIKAMDAGMTQAERARVRAQEESDRMAEISLNAFERGSKRRKRKKKKSTDEEE